MGGVAVHPDCLPLCNWPRPQFFRSGATYYYFDGVRAPGAPIGFQNPPTGVSSDFKLEHTDPRFMGPLLEPSGSPHALMSNPRCVRPHCGVGCQTATGSHGGSGKQSLFCLGALGGSADTRAWEGNVPHTVQCCKHLTY